jgi:hypothetical protein
MPELTVSRSNTTPPPMVCMYCGAPATATQVWREVNRKPDKNGGDGGTLMPVVVGDDPASAILGLLLLPLVLWELLKVLSAALGAVVGFANRPRPTPTSTEPASPPKERPTTRIVVTACERHRQFRNRFIWAGLGMVLVLLFLWVWAIIVTRRVMGTDNTDFALTLILTAIFATVVLPLALSFWYTFAGPVIVDRVTAETVILDRVRPAYFEATGLKPTNPT